MLALLGVITVVPYLVIAAWGILVDPSSWWLFVIIFIATWPVVVLPMAALYYQAKQSRK